MKILLTFTIMIITIQFPEFIVAQQQTLSAGSTLLFKNVKSKTTVAEKNKIFQLSGLALSKDKKKLTDDPSPDSPNFEFEIYPLDLNNDGTEEIFIILHSPMYGMTGATCNLYIKTNGVYASDKGIGGGVPLLMTTAHLGYTDILIGGAGIKAPVYTWNGRQYDLFKEVDFVVGGDLKTVNLEDAGKTYSSTLK